MTTGSRNTLRTLWATSLVLLAAVGIGVPLSVASAQAQSAPVAATAAPSSDALREAEAAAARAEEAAREARAFAATLAEKAEREAAEAARAAEIEAARQLVREAEVEAARQLVREADERAAAEASARREAEIEAAAAAAEASAAARTTAAPRAAGEAPVTRGELEDAVDAAEEAADDAWVAARAAERANRDREQAFETGPYLGAAFVYGAEQFDDDLVIKSSLGAAGFVGWRINPHFATEVRYTAFDGFDLQGSNGEAEIDGFAVTLNAKVYPITTRIQPFISLGVGALHLEQETRLDDGARFSEQETAAIFRVGAGVDFPLSERLILNLEAAYIAPTDNLADFDITELSTGITYRF